ncbi:MAG: ATP-binding protein [Bacteroidia bacterium]|nr:ATP-binding protein [Bacteroidia bacterium]MDW8236347.1 ATP-binding protein [Bacteroidia bacterium]
MAGLTVRELLERLTRAELLAVAREGREKGLFRPTYALSHYNAQSLRHLLLKHLDRLDRLSSIQQLMNRYNRPNRSEPLPRPITTVPSLDSLCQKLFPGVYGMEAEKEALVEWVYLPLLLPEQASYYGASTAPAIILEGPPGGGKSFLVRQFAQASGFYYRIVHTPALASKWYGETEKRLRILAQKALRRTPALLIFEEVDALFPDREKNLEWLHGITLQFLLLIDEIKGKGRVAIIGITNRADRLDSALLRSERFDRRLYITAPDKEERLVLFQQMAERMPFASGISWEVWAERTAGFSRADIVRLLQEAGYRAFLRHYHQQTPQVITENDLHYSFKSL